MAGALIRFDLSLPYYFTYPPGPGVGTRPMIPRKEERQLYMRGEFGIKPDGGLRPISAHSTTHLDLPFHFIASAPDLAGMLNRADTPADRPCLARVVFLGGDGALPSAFTRDGVTYCEAVSEEVLPSAEELRGYEALVVLTGFGEIMARQKGEPYPMPEVGAYHVPHFTLGAAEHIVASGLKLVAIDSTTVEPQTSQDPVRFSSDVHFMLLGNDPPVLIVEGLGGEGFAEKVGFIPREGLLHIVPRRVNEKGAEAAHSRAFLYFYRDDPAGEELRRLAEQMQPEELYG